MSESWIRVSTAEELESSGHRVVQIPGAPVLVLWNDGTPRAIDNRCPHLGFPLHRGDIKDGLLDCHWHHARFDISCGATLDPWADDVDCYSVEVRDTEVYLNPERPRRDPLAWGMDRLNRGLEYSLRLVIAKAILQMDEDSLLPGPALDQAARFGATRRESGWAPGLSMLAAMANLAQSLDEPDRNRALVHSIAHIASDCAGRPPRRPLPALEGSQRTREGLDAWFRECVETRDADGAERTLATLVDVHGHRAALTSVVAACTDHCYTDGGHTLDFAAKCAELVDHVGKGKTAQVLFTSLVPQLVGMQRMEETPAWRRPVDVAAMSRKASASLQEEWFAGDSPVSEEPALVDLLLGENPQASVDALLQALQQGTSCVALAETVIHAATLRVLRFGTANEHSDWDTVHHTLTYASATAEICRRIPGPVAFRAVLDGAMSVYLDRFLNIPPARLPEDMDATGLPTDPAQTLDSLLALYDGRSDPNRAGLLAWHYLALDGSPQALFATLGTAVLREDADFHLLQALELAWRRQDRLGDCTASRQALAALARWIAAQLPTRRAREQTFQIASRLTRGEALHSGS